MSETPNAQQKELEAGGAPQPETGGAPQSEAGGAPQSEAGERPAPSPGMRWYVLRVASNKEEQVRDALTRKAQIENMVDRIGRVLVPTVPERRIKGGQSRVYNRKLYPGYVFVEMRCEEDGSIQEDVWFMIKETTGVGDFIGSEGKPSPMNEPEVEKMLAIAERPDQTGTLVSMQFKKGDRVKIREGSFENFEGEVESTDEQKQTVTVLITIFGRSTPVDVEYWNLERI
jgi:transcriptional antiterminator NusG